VHYPGTFWFHPHVHGATGIQVGSGMSGAWIIEGDYDNIPALDAADEHLFLMQHVAWESVSPMAAGDTCDQDNLSINDFAEITTQSRTLVNGRLEQWMAVAPDQAQHWRFIHAGVTDEMRIGLFPATSTDCSTWDETSPVAMFQIAADGLALQSRFSREELFMAPGYRIDVNFRAPTSDGLWCLIGERPAAGPPGPGAVAVDDLLARLMVDSDLTATSTALASSAHLASVAAPTIDCSSVPDGTQTALFDDPSPLCPPLNIDCRTFTDSVTDPRLLAVETLDEWTVTAGRATHPFHIHVNPFTVCDDRDDEPPAPHWRDTLMLTNVSASLMMEYPFYTGSFVTHCHKLNHEDSGMMEVIEIQ
jgi:L-ascorbate oxidase